MDRRVLTVPLSRLRERTSVKWRLYPPDVLPLWVAEMDVDPAPPVADAVRAAIARGDLGYAWAPPYVDAFVDLAAERWRWTVDPRAVRLVPDVMIGAAEVIDLLTEPGGAVIINTPVYPPFRSFVEHAGRRVLEAPLTSQGRLDPLTLEEAFTRASAVGGPAAYLLCSPHNPTGAVHTADELVTVGELAARHGVRVVADEIHAPLVLPGTTFVPYLSLPTGADAVSLVSASKAWNLAGLKAALAVAGPEARADLDRMPEIVGHGASHVAVQAHTAALVEGRGWLDDLLLDLDDNRRLLADLLADQLPGVRYAPADGTYFAWLDFRDLGLGHDPAALFLARGRVALNAGPTFGAEGRGFARLNLATSPDVLTEAVRRMASVTAA